MKPGELYRSRYTIPFLLYPSKEDITSALDAGILDDPGYGTQHTAEYLNSFLGTKIWAAGDFTSKSILMVLEDNLQLSDDQLKNSKEWTEWTAVRAVKILCDDKVGWIFVSEQDLFTIDKD